MKRSFPWNWALGALAISAGAGVMSVGEAPHTQRQVPSVEAHADAGTALVALASWVPGRLPPALPGQRKPPCRKQSLGEEEIEGYCWIRLTVGPPCTPGETFEHGNACYIRPRADPVLPTTGDVRPPAIAD